MNKFFGALVVLLAGIALCSSCNDPASIGSELLDQDQVDVFFSDTLSIKTETIQSDSLKTFESGNNLITNFNCGNFDDPVFGNVSAQIFSQFRLGSAIVPNFVGTSNSTLDSLVLYLAYDTVGLYGDFSQNASLEVYRVIEDMDNTVDYYSTDSFLTDETEVLGELIDFPVNPFVTDSILNNNGTVAARGSFLKINLTDVLGNELLSQDSATYANSENFVDFLKGINIRAVGASNNVMLSFNLTSELTRLSLYYTRDTTKFNYNYQVTAASTRTIQVEHTTSSTVQNAIADPNSDLLYLQGLNGTDVRITFPNISDFGDIIVNKAELEFTIQEEASPNDLFYPLPDQIILAEPGDGSNDVFLIEDVVFALSRNSLGGIFGGIVEEEMVEGNLLKKYRLNISGHFQDVIDGTISDTLFLRVTPKQEQVARTILFGQNHTEFPAKLKLSYTIP